MIAILLTLVAAHAHPGGGAAGLRGEVGQRTELRVGPDAVRLVYVADVPRLRLYRELQELTGLRASGMTPDADPAARLPERLRELRAGLSVAFDGQPLPLREEAVEVPLRPGDAGFVELRLAGSAALPRPEGELVVRLGNWPDEEGWFAHRVEVDGTMVVTGSSLARTRPDGRSESLHDAWIRDGHLRELRVRVRPARWNERAGGAHPLPARLADTAGTPLWAHALGVGLLVASAVAGRRLGRRARAQGSPDTLP
jgi:hypothetical protein